LVEQPIRNRQVSGSSPLVGSIILIGKNASSKDFLAQRFASSPDVARIHKETRPARSAWLTIQTLT
jgi:hypothetical protein